MRKNKDGRVAPLQRVLTEMGWSRANLCAEIARVTGGECFIPENTILIYCRGSIPSRDRQAVIIRAMTERGGVTVNAKALGWE